jgi:hypothetical protein
MFALTMQPQGDNVSPKVSRGSVKGDSTCELR